MPDQGQPIGLNFSALLPQFSYDILARLVPGWLLITTGAVVLTSPEQFASWAQATLTSVKDLGSLLGLFLIILLNLAAYLVATMVSGLTYWASHSLPVSGAIHAMKGQQVVRAKSRAIRQLRQMGEEHAEDLQLPDYPILYDGLRIAAPAAGARLTKTRAEYHMCRGLAAGLLFLAVLNALIHDLHIGGASESWWRVVWELFGILLLMIVTTPDIISYPESWVHLFDRLGPAKRWARGALATVLAVSLFAVMFFPEPLYEGASSAAQLEMVLVGVAVLFLYKSIARRQRFLEGIYNHWVVLRYEPHMLRPKEWHGTDSGCPVETLLRCVPNVGGEGVPVAGLVA